MKKHLGKRLLSFFVVLTMIFGLIPSFDVNAAESPKLTWKETDKEITSDFLGKVPEKEEEPALYEADEMVRVSIVLKGKSTLQAGFSTKALASNEKAAAYSANLLQQQKKLESTIEAKVLDGKELDVVWNMTLVGNMISANIPYGKIEAIEKLIGVEQVVLEQQYQPQDTTAGSIEANMSGSAAMVGAQPAWLDGYTGVNKRIAVIDTGIDTDHQSFSSDGFLHSLKMNAELKEMSYSKYMESVDLMNADDISAVLTKLHAYERGATSAEDLYVSEKIPFGYNYVDYNYTINHDSDYQGSHGSHVSGIAAANSYIPSNGDYIDASEAVGVKGIAPDAQILTMKVFGNAAGPYDSDYMCAIEDAILLEADAVNLSLGSANPGVAYNDVYAELLSFLETTDTVVAISAGNSGAWADAAAAERLYDDGVNFDTVGSPGSYTNAFTVASVNNANSSVGDMPEYFTMSDFSSWGVPGDLSLKPEITAPGGSIYSVNGMDISGSGYEYMSGTSMAAPQVTGMSALVDQYLEESGIAAKSSLTNRTLVHSLLMSTAAPLREEASGGNYYSVLKQGAGLAQADKAIEAESYILVKDTADGKVKVELGDDPERTGLYKFSFTINNLNGKTMDYDLSADVFTQAIVEDSNEIKYLDAATRALSAVTSFSSNGQSLESASGSFASDFKCDLNGDGSTTIEDADYLLEYVVGNVSKLYADGDLSGDGKITSYDAHVFLSKQSSGYAVTVPANGSVTVDVTMKLTDACKAYLNENYPVGAYVEAFVYAVPAEGVVHSVPVLGFYGSWTDSSMYDVGSWLEYNYNTETRAPYLYNETDIYNNYFTVSYEGSSDEYLFGGNPIVEEAQYLAKRAAFNNKNGNLLEKVNFSLIRNAANLQVEVVNNKSGQMIDSQEYGQTDGAYYWINGGLWQNTEYNIGLGLNFSDLAEGTSVSIHLTAAPEYYKDNSSGTVDWDALGKGATYSTSFVIDNTAPTATSITMDESVENRLHVVAKDNQYVAAVRLLDETGNAILAEKAADQTEANAEKDIILDLGYVYGSKFIVAVYDYAANYTTYEVELELSSERPYFTGINRTDENADGTINYVGLDADGNSAVLAKAANRSLPRVATCVDGYVFEVTDDHKLYVGPNENLNDMTCVSDLDPSGEWDITGFNALAYNHADGKLYGSFYSNLNGLSTPYLCTIDLFTGAMTVLGAMPIDANSMAIDKNGNFYSCIYGNTSIYKYQSDIVSTGSSVCIGTTSYSTELLNAMFWDYNTDELYWACTADQMTYLLKVDPSTAAVTLVTTYPFIVSSMYVSYDIPGEILAPTDKVQSISILGPQEALAGTTAQLAAVVAPWNVTDKTVTWTSANTSVANVDQNGLVTGVAAGTTTITATSVLDKNVKATINFTVSELDKELYGVVWDEESNVFWSSFNIGKLPEYNQICQATDNLPFVSTMIADGTLYASTMSGSGLADLYTVNPSTFQSSKVGGSDSIFYADMAYAPNVGYGIGLYANYVTWIDLDTGDYIGAYDWTESSTELIGITYYGSEYNTYYSAWMDYFLILDIDGNVYLEAFINTDGTIGYFNGPEDGYITNIGDAVDVSYFQGFYYDGSMVYWTRLNTADNEVELIVWNPEDEAAAISIGTFESGLWPVGGLFAMEELSTTTSVGSLAERVKLNANGVQSKAEPNKLQAASVTNVEPKAFVQQSKASKAAGNLMYVVNSSGNSQEEAGVTTITLDVTQLANTTNGRLTVDYDADALTVASVTGKTEAFAHAVKDGKIDIAYASASENITGSDIAKITFQVKSGNDFTFTMTHSEAGNSTVNQTETVEVNVKEPVTNPFIDVPENQYYYEPVLWAVDKGITSGLKPNQFAPEESCTRGQVVTFLWRAHGCPEPTTTTHNFTDLKANEYYYKAVLWAVEKGITSGMTKTTFAPDVTVTRGQFVTFLHRAEGKPAYTASNPFTDLKTGEYYYDAVLWAVENGVTSGLKPTLFGPEEPCTRGQVVTFLYRAYK